MNKDIIYRQAAIDALREGAMVNYQAAGHDNGLIKAIDVIKGLPSAKPEISLLTVKVTPDLEELERTVRKIKDTSVMLLPPVEPERKKGKWIVDALANNIWHCSECGTDAPVEPTGGTEYKSNYCPYCGLDMRGETDED